MENERNPLHIFFLPLVLQGHMIPMMDMAKTFATRGAKVTIVTTPICATLCSKQIKRVHQLGLEFNIQTIKLPLIDIGLPEGWENMDAVTWSQNQADFLRKFWKALTLLQEPVLHILEEHRPDSLVVDLFFPWATDVAAQLKIPRLAFGGTTPHLRGEIKLTRTQLPEYLRQEEETDFSKLAKEIVKSELKSYGNNFYSFCELEKDYADYYRNVLGKKAWHNDLKKPNSVIHVCFGSLTKFNSQQLVDMAKGLEASQQDFIWIVRKDKNEEQYWLPEGFEERMDGKGLIIRGWAPLVLILDHESVGGFVTRCGWNSIMERVCARGRCLLSNSIMKMLQIGIGVGSKQYADFGIGADVVRSDDIEVVVRRIMAEEMRRAKRLGRMARTAVGEGGSSDSDLTSLIEELRRHKVYRESR
ncbi:hypothetical protein BT93_J1319 [Corymbia citriodora subsp. variegata]|nr:hypothetical protein BT93_J1319 [Corymbia citriodora subsp. variegata]